MIMRKLTTGMAAVAAVVVGAVTLRKVRGGAVTADEVAEESVDPVHEEAETPAEHAVAALEHGRLAVEQTIEARRE